MRQTWNRWFSLTTMVLLVVLAGLAVAPSSAVVVPQDDPLREQEFRHSDLWYENVFRPVAELPAGAMRTLGSELSRLGVDPGHAFFDLRTGRWGTLILLEPMIPGTGVRNDLEWSSLGYDAAPQGEALKQAVWDELRGYLSEHAAELRIDPQELAEPIVTVIGDRLVYIHVGRQIDGIPVRDTFVKAALNSGNLVLYGERNWGPVEVSTAPGLSAAEAEDVVRGHVEGFSFAGLREEPRLELIPTSSQPEEAASLLGAGLGYRLAWVLTPDFENHIGNWEALVDAHSGELLSFVDTNHYASRRVEAWVYPVSNDGIPPDGVMQPGFPMPFADITLDGTDVGFATTGGNAPTGSDAGTMATTLSGQFIRMNDQCGAMNESAAAGDLDLEGLPFPATDCEVPAGHSPGDTQASRTGFYELNRLAEQARGYLPDNVWLQQQLTAVMNIPQICNANWNGSTVNFFRSAIPQGCRNTGEIAGVFDHEWGHGMDDNDGNGFVSNPGEGIADIFAHNRLNTSCIGRGFFIDSQCNGYGDPCLDCTGIRDIDWEKRVSQQPHDIDWIDANCDGGPAPCGGIVHCEGAVYSEAEYDLVHRDLQGFEGSPWNLDDNTALEIGTRLSLYGSSNVGNWYQCTNDGTGGCNSDGGYLGFLVADDDNGDITDGTPHMSAIFAAFERHQISCNAPAVVDSGCAGAPTDAPANLVADTFDEGAQLTWDAVAGAEEYWIFRTEGVHGCDFGKALIGKATETTFTETGLRNGFEVFYSVSAVGASDACVSPMSECLSVIPTAGPSGFIEGTVTDADTGEPIAGASVEAVGPVTVGDETAADGTYSILAPVGTYDVTADAEDYDPQTVTGVEVTEGGTQVVDFQLTLTPVPIADISPDSFSFAVQQGDTGSDTLNMGNIGVLDLVWSIVEDDAPAPAAQPLMLEEWSDNFDSYDTGSQLHGQGGWKGWLNDPAAGALVSDAQAQSPPNSAEIVGASDLVHEYVDSNSGQWTYTAWNFIPTDFTGTSMFIMLNTYNDGGSGLNWSTQVEFRGAEESVVNAGLSGGTLPLVRGQWVELRVEIDLEADTQEFFYNGELLYAGTWTQEVSGGGALNIGVVDLFANGASPVYYDDMSLTDVTVAPPCTEPSDVPWLSVNPESGTTPPDSTVPVDVTVDTTGLDEGDVSALLCITTNDPDAELVQIPVDLTVLPAGGPVADVSPDSFTFTVEQGDSDDETLNIGNLGGQELTWDVDEAESALLPVIVPEGAPYRYGLAETPEFNAPVGGSRASGITRGRGEAPADPVVLPAPQPAAIGSFTEGFDDITTLPGAGWAMINNSEPVGPSSWFQGNETIFPSHEGAPDAYIAANYESAEDGGDISNWLLTPEVTIVNGTTACFWTRTTEQFEEFYDRLEVRMSIAGDSTDVGDTAESVGDFTDLLLSINPDLMPNEYPEDWTEFCVTVRERSREPVTGRFAFRYWVTDTSVNGDYIGIDTASVTQPDEVPPGNCDNPVDIPWLAIDPASGTTPPLDSVPADVSVNTADLDLGTFTAQLCVNTNDPDNPQISVPVTLNVVEDDGVPEILLVDDDDNSPDARAFFTDTLDAMGQAYDIWDTENSDNEPTAAELEPYDAVVWFTGDSFGGFAGPGADGEGALGTWLDDGGCFFISSQDYLFDRDLTPFMQNYLGVSEFTNDQGQTEVTGAGSVFGGLGPYTLVYPFTNFSDIISPDGTAELAFSGNVGDAAPNKDSGVYKTTFWGFPFAALPDSAAREESMFTFLDWCGATDPTGFIAGTVTDLTNGGAPIEGADVTAGTRTVQTDVDGNYSMRVPVGTYDVTASKENYVPVTVPGVEVVVDETTAVDFELEGSTLAYDPDAIEQSMESGDVVSTTVTLTATGPLPVDFEVNIVDFEGPSASPSVRVNVLDGAAGAAPRAAVRQSTPAVTRSDSRVSPEVSKFIRDRGRDGGTSGAAMDLASVLGEPLPSVPVMAALGGGVDCDAEPGIIIHDDGTIENGYSGNPSLVSEVRFVDKFTPDSYPATFSNVCVAFVTLNETTLNFDVVVYDDDGPDSEPGTELGSLAVSAEGIPTFPNPTPVWFSYDISSLGLSIPDGDVYIGVRYAPPSAPNVFTAADESTGNPPGFAGGYWWNNNDGFWAPTQTVFPVYRSMMIRAVGGTAGTIWAHAEPESGTVQPGEPFTLEVIFDATELVQEGTYTANMEFSGSFVNDVAPMPLTMHLTCPTCGTLAGAITDATTGDPLSATITVVGDGGFTTSVEGETYSITAPADTYSITAEADGYLPQTVEGIVLGAGETVTTDFALVAAVAILEYTPESIEADMEPGDVVTTPVTVTNPGTIPLEFSVAFVDFEGPGVSQPVRVERRSSSSVRAGVGEDGGSSWTDPKLAVVEPGRIVSNDFESLGSLTFYDDRGEFDGVHPDLPLEDFSDTNVPDGQVVTCLPPFNSESDDACFSPGDILPGVSMDVTPNGGPGDAVVLTPPFAGVPCVSVGPNTFVDFADWDFNPPVPAVGFDMQSNVGGASFTLTIFGPDGELGSTDVTVGGLGAPSFFGVDTSDGAGITRIEVRDTAGAGELFCNVAFGGSLGPVWAHAEPDSGTVPPGESVTFDVIFDASELIQEGTYTANMRFSGNFSNEPADMPLTLNLTCPTCGTLAGSITDATTGDPLPATITVTGDGGFTTTVEGETYSITAPADTYSITAEADGYLPQTIEGIVLAAGDTVTTDFALVAAIAVLEYTPASIEETLPLGGTASNTVTVSNTGTIPLDFSVSILNFEGPSAAQPVRVSVVDRRPGPGAVRSGEGGAQTAMDLASVLGGPLPSLPVMATLGGVDCDAEPGIIIHDDGTIENGYSGNPSLVSEVRFVDKFTPAGYPATFSNVCVAFVTLNETTLNFDVVVYDDDGADGAPGTELGSLAVTAEGIPTFPNPAPVWFSYDISSLELSIPDGDVYIGVRYAPPSAPNVFTAADESTVNPPGFAGGYWWNDNDGFWAPIQNVFPTYRSMMVRAVGGIAGPVWATADPDSGTVAPGEEVTFEVIFDASVVTELGTYTADLRFSGNFSNEPADMPLTMNVTE